MQSYEYPPPDWFSSRKRPGFYRQRPPPMTRPVSKSFNRISDFIFPDTIHIQLHQQQKIQQPINRRYERAENYSLPVLNRYHPRQRDLIVVERVPFDQLNDVDMLYREQNQQQLYQQQQQQQQYHNYHHHHHHHQQQQQQQPHRLYEEQRHSFRPVRRRYSSITDEGRPQVHERVISGLTARPAAYTERIRDRRKRHTTDNAYHSMMKSMLEEDEEELQNMNLDGQNYLLSYKTTLDPITDTESMASIYQQKQKSRQISTLAVDEWKRQTHGRVPMNGMAPTGNEQNRFRQTPETSSLSSSDSSSDTDITERHPSMIHIDNHPNDSSMDTSVKGPPAVSMPRPAVWERLESDPIRFRHEPDIFVPINPPSPDANNRGMNVSNNFITTNTSFDQSVDYQVSKSPSAKQEHDSSHHVSLCVNDLRTTLYIDQDVLNSTKTTLSSPNGKATIKTFIDRIIKRLQHFKRSLDHGLIHVRKRNHLVDGPIISAEYRSQSEKPKRKHHYNQSFDHQLVEQPRWIPVIDENEENKLIQPYFLIRPQTVLLLTHETAKFKCCFGGDPLPSMIWSHNDSRIPELLASDHSNSSHYRIHKLHDIHYLDIGPVTTRDNGQIKCTIMNRAGREEVIARLIVVECASEAAPSISEILSDTKIIEGRPLKLSCKITGLQVTVNWFHNGKLISPANQSKSDYSNENSIFSLSRCLRSDAGTVDCIVKNRFGEAKTTCRIEIINDPELDR